MKATELRIGNLIYNFGIPITVNAKLLKKIDQINQTEKTIIDLTYIPLTEEWLLDFGFEEIIGWYTKGRLELFNINNSYFTTPSRDIVSVSIIHVHQLQNLYFALTGTELKLNQEQQREFLIKDNTIGGEWDRDILVNEWDADDIEEKAQVKTE